MIIDPGMYESQQTLSLLDSAGVGIETYCRGDDRMTVAFVAGLPIPFDIMTALLVRRLCGRAFEDTAKTLKDDVTERLSAFWEGVGKPPLHARMKANGEDEYSIAYRAVREMFVQLKQADDPAEGLAFMVGEIETRYAASLESPIAID